MTKESGKKDDEIKGEGNSLNYTFRMYDPRVGRFFAVDPLAPKYPHNSPYAFSENRVIDGVELEGLEYITRVHTVNNNGKIVATKDYIYYQMSEEDIEKIGGTPQGWYNAGSHSKGGEGVKHLYFKENKLVAERWDLPRNTILDAASTHGLYSGGGCVTTDGFSNNYDFSWQPIDIADAIAKRHDMNYGDTKIEGYSYRGYVEDVRTVGADYIMLDQIDQVLNQNKQWNELGLERPFRTDISGEARSALHGQKYIIGLLAKYKSWKLTVDWDGSILDENFAKQFKEAGGTKKEIKILQKMEQGRRDSAVENEKQENDLKEKLKNE